MRAHQDELRVKTKVVPKDEKTRDLETIFTMKVDVTFKYADGTRHVEEGRWCMICR